MLALIPLLFALHQTLEGIVWLSMDHKIPFIPYGDAAKTLFLTIAFVVWPIWIPLSLYLAEKEKIRSSLLLLLVASGTLLAAFNAYKGLTQHVDVIILGKSLRYVGELPDETFFYLPVIVLPSFISSLRLVWLFGLCIAVTALGADYIYEKMFVSVWCFFAAIVSVVIFFVVRDDAKATLNRLP